MGSTPHLEIEDLRVDFRTYDGRKRVLQLGHLHVDHGEALGLVGESGCGKSVLALSVLRLLRCPPAEIVATRLALNQRDLLALSDKAVRTVRGREIAMIFQDPMSSLNPVFTVGSQLLNVIRRTYGEKGRQAYARALKFIRLVGLPDPENMVRKYPHQLSGGQRQRVIIALALCCDAKFIIADEPTRNLDVTVQAGVLKTISRLQHELGVSLLFIANNLALVAAMCDRVAIMLDGRIVETGTVDEVIADARHPYTHALLQAIPLAGSGEEAARILASTEAADMRLGETDALEADCPYVLRCSERDAVCGEIGRIGLVSVGGTHEVACRMAVRQLVAL